PILSFELARYELRRAPNGRERILYLVRKDRRPAQRPRPFFFGNSLALPRVGQRDRTPSWVGGERRNGEIGQQASAIDHYRQPPRDELRLLGEQLVPNAALGKADDFEEVATDQLSRAAADHVLGGGGNLIDSRAGRRDKQRVRQSCEK